MYRFLMAFCLVIISSIVAFAQDTDEQYKKNEFFVGYSNQQVTEGSRQTFNGFEASYARNVSRYFGVKGDFSAAYEFDSFSADITIPNVGNATTLNKNDSSVYNFLGGVQIKDNASKKKLKPFAHALVGVAHNRRKFTTTCISGNCNGANLLNGTFTDTGFAGAFGGGLDIKLNDKIDIRAIQVDYNPIYSNTRINNNVRIGIGIVFK